MRVFTTTVAVLAILTGTRFLPAQLGGETYDLLQGSSILDECVFCDRAPIERPLTGSFVLTQLPSLVCCVYQVSDLTFDSPEGDYTMTGEGNYSTSSIGEVTQQLGLILSLNAVEGVELKSGPVKIEVPFPVIEITVTEDGTRDPSHKYTIKLVAAPRTERVDYELVSGEGGSYFVDGCLVCERPDVLVPLTGSFRLGRIVDQPNGVSLFVVDFVDFRGPDESGVQNGGAGTYEHGGEVAITQLMNLNLDVNGDPDNILDSGRVPVPEGVVFPDITIDLAHQNPKSDLHVYSLHLVAKPAASNLRQFRRGDANSDGTVDLSDAVFVLTWLFSGSHTPQCLDSADTNFDEKHDLTDAVYVLGFLFQGGPEPPKPGSASCGFPEQPVFGCEAYPSC